MTKEIPKEKLIATQKTPIQDDPDKTREHIATQEQIVKDMLQKVIEREKSTLREEPTKPPTQTDAQEAAINAKIEAQTAEVIKKAQQLFNSKQNSTQ